MSDKTMKIILSALTAVLLVLIVCLFAFKGNNPSVDLNKLAVRIGEIRQYKSMGRADMTTSMERSFSRVGYDVVTTTEDNQYPATAEDAGVNFYVRGYVPFNELKTNKNAVNIVYIRDYDTLQQEELDAFDGIATSSPDFYNFVMSSNYAAVYLPEFTEVTTTIIITAINPININPINSVAKASIILKINTPTPIKIAIVFFLLIVFLSSSNSSKLKFSISVLLKKNKDTSVLIIY